MKRLIIAVAMLVSGPALANPLALDVESLSNGVVQTIKLGDGRYSTITYEKDGAGGYRFLRRLGDDLDNLSAQATVTITADGQWTSQVRVGEKPILYEPHNCVRTLGSCRYVIRVGETGRTFRVQRVTEPNNEGGYDYKLYVDTATGNEVAEQGSFILDERGFTKEISMSRLRSSATFTLVDVTYPD